MGKNRRKSLRKTNTTSSARPSQREKRETFYVLIFSLSLSLCLSVSAVVRARRQSVCDFCFLSAPENDVEESRRQLERDIKEERGGGTEQRRFFVSFFPSGRCSVYDGSKAIHIYTHIVDTY